MASPPAAAAAVAEAFRNFLRLEFVGIRFPPVYGLLFAPPAVCQRFPVLLERMHEIAGNFSGGQNQMLAIARGLMASPKLLILDEPSLGLSPVLVSQIFQLISGLRDGGVAILLSEQNARLSLAIADRGYVIEKGRVTASGQGRELLHSSDIAERYLGVGAALGKSDEARDQKLTVMLHELMRC